MQVTGIVKQKMNSVSKPPIHSLVTRSDQRDKFEPFLFSLLLDRFCARKQESTVFSFPLPPPPPPKKCTKQERKKKSNEGTLVRLAVPFVFHYRFGKRNAVGVVVCIYADG